MILFQSVFSVSYLCKLIHKIIKNKKLFKASTSGNLKQHLIASGPRFLDSDALTWWDLIS